MSEKHQHKFRYTVTMLNRHWWGGRQTFVIVGVGSSKQGDELLVHEEGGAFHSINFAHVWKMTVRPIEHKHEA